MEPGSHDELPWHNLADRRALRQPTSSRLGELRSLRSIIGLEKNDGGMFAQNTIDREI